MSSLFTTFKLRDLKFRNRIFMSPMCQYSAREGVANEWHAVHLGSRAVGGAGLVMVEATAIVPEGRITPACLGLWSDEQVRALAPVAAFAKSQGAVPAIQLAHAGRKAATNLPWLGGAPVGEKDGGWPTVAPSAVPFATGYSVPRALSHDEIGGVVAAFKHAASNALKAGFDIVEIHMAHGYLLHTFLSALSNHRTDEYGGSLENRMRLPLHVAREVRALWPQHLPVFVRISATDWMDGGWDIAQSIVLVQALKKCGIDLIDCSTGGLVSNAMIPVAPGFQVPFSARIRAEVGIATGAVGLITDAQQADAVITSGEADVVLLGRELLRNPYWPLHAAKTLGVDVTWPHQYARAKI